MTTQHQKCKGLKMETLHKNQCYAVTLSPPDRRSITGAKMVTGNELQTYKILEMNINEDLQLFKKLKFSSLEIYPELSPTGRLHYHGLIQIHDVLRFMYHDLHILNQISYEIDTLSNDEQSVIKYTNYVVKQTTYWDDYKDFTSTEFPLKVNKMH